MFPPILGAVVIGGILYLLSSDENWSEDTDQSQKRQQAVESQEKIRELRKQLRKEVKARNRALRHLQPVETEDSEE